MAELLLGRVTGATPAYRALVRTLDERDERPATTSSSWASARCRASCRSPAWLRRDRVQEPGRRHRGAQPRLLNPRRRRSSTDDAAQRSEYLTFMFVGAGYAGIEALRRARGLRERHHRGVSALPRGRDALGDDRGAGPDHAGDPGEPQPRSRERAEAARDGDPDRHDASRAGRARRDLDGRATADTAGLDRGREGKPG